MLVAPTFHQSDTTLIPYGDTTDGARPEQPSVSGPASPKRLFRQALSLYLMWSAVACLSHLAGQTTLTAEAVVILLAGIIATNLMFFALTNTTTKHGLPQSTVVLAQGVFAIVWVTLYGFLSDGPGEIVPFIYVTTLFFAMSAIARRSLLQLALFSGVSYVLVFLLKGFLGSPAVTTGQFLVQFFLFVGTGTFILLHGIRIHELKMQLAQRTASLQSIIDKMACANKQEDADISSKRYFMLQSLVREKGKTDRSNHPFSICIVDMDGTDDFIEQYGAVAAQHVLKGFAKRLRGALRAMDTANPSGFKRRFGRFVNDEYIVIMPQTGLAGARQCAERIRNSIRRRSFDDTYRPTVSGGVAEYKRGETIPELLARADSALRHAKRAGGDRIICSEPKEARHAEILPLRKIPS